MSTLADKLVSVQPLLGPVGLVYYLRYRYSGHKKNMEVKEEEELKKKKKYRDIDDEWEL